MSFVFDEIKRIKREFFGKVWFCFAIVYFKADVSAGLVATLTKMNFLEEKTFKTRQITLKKYTT